MDTTSSVGGRTMAMTNNGRAREYSGGVQLNGVESERQSHSTLGWGHPSIWGNSTTIGSGFAQGARDNTRPRENSTYLGATASSNALEGKTGSGSLVPSSESESWTTRSPWRDSTAASKPHARSSGVSPARKRSIAHAQPGQQYTDPSSAFFLPRSVIGPITTVSKPALDPTTGNFTSTRTVDPSISSSFSNFAFSEPTSQRPEPSTSNGSWDNASVHSPNDDRRSVTDFYGTTSSTPSRSGSLPPSRHGDPTQLSQSGDNFSRYAHGNRQHSSFSHANGRAYQERSGSIQSDGLQLLGRLSLEQEHETPGSHRASISVNGPGLGRPGNDLAYSRDNFADMKQDENGFVGVNNFVPEGFPNGINDATTAQYGAFRFDSRSAPNGTAAKQSPFYSHSGTPPAFDHLYPSRGEQVLSTGNNFALVNSKLAGFQQQQERRNFAPNPYPQQGFHPLLPPQSRQSYGYAVALQNGFPLHPMGPNIQMSMMPQMVAVMEPPKAPREHHHHQQQQQQQQQTGESLMSKCLWDYRQSSKSGTRKYDLKDIYDHVVEFSGDQHGSRFIQSKLEVANSDEKDRVFRELQGDSLQLMQDVFGNYVIQKFFEHGDQTQKRILANRMKGHVYHLSMQMYGCRVVQKALEHILTDQQALLVKELEKDVLACVKDQNGNHVVQKAIERVPFEHIKFIVEAFKGQVGTLSVNGYGCRVIQRMLEFVPEPARRFILVELRAEGSKLITDQYGNYVAQHVIEHGTGEDSQVFIDLVTNDILLYSKHKFASNVVERCLVCGTDAQRRAISLRVTAKNERGECNLKSLIRDNYGNYVIQKILETLCEEDWHEFVAILRPEMEEAKKVISGKQVVQIEKKLHRFDRVDSVSSTTPQLSSISSVTDDVPVLTSESQSPQSTTMPPDNLSTIGESPHSVASISDKALPTSSVQIVNDS
ncbi:ARM repeat-containing protein [Aaosphaeria arxii CBS 175.79]|uniref:ARM repeat-containing protein n=1 Tax=Aaosphaeria arxii CBS 175.79 TaxID=1450172 RepID=A0A6A5XV24_9PLEO|nr:ARM repeat-containing protein [Aaosphaeria arxii CBS 175.79]KAF2016561.1 ARM repeat-containing protein [Aaosphaeria arxii CBS 175.79]